MILGYPSLSILCIITSTVNLHQPPHPQQWPILKLLLLILINRKLNYSEAARKFKLDRMTLQRRYTGKTGSPQEENSKYRQLLNDVEEDTLLRYVDGLANRRIPPTHQIVRNLAEEILGGPVGDHWPKRFVKRHQNRVCSVYLKSTGHSRAFLNLLLFSSATMQLYCFRVVIASIAKFCASWPKQLRPTTLLPNISTTGMRRASL